MPAPEADAAQPGPLLPLAALELRALVRGNALWGSLLVIVLVAGYSYVQAIRLYGEASQSALGVPELARGLSPLDGVVAPTCGALYLAATFLLPFIAIRTVAADRQSGALGLLLQLPYSTATIVAAKFGACVAAWLLLAAPCLAALAFWRLAGGHLGWVETGNLLLGHFLYGLIVAAVALLAAAVTSQVANAGILTLAVTLGSWVLDFAAAGDDGLLKQLSGLSLTQLVRSFEHGVFSLAAVLGALVATATLATAAGLWLHPGRPPRRQWTLTLLVVAVAGVALAGSTRLRLFRDTAEDRRNSFAASDELALRAIDAPLRIEVHLAAEDPRLHDFEHNVLGKLRRVLSDVEIVSADQGFHRVLTGGDDQSYGLIVYSMNGRRQSSRSTSEDEVLPILFALAGRERPPAAPGRDYPGYPAVVDGAAAATAFYGVFPALIAASWGLLRFGDRLDSFRKPRSAS